MVEASSEQAALVLVLQTPQHSPGTPLDIPTPQKQLLTALLRPSILYLITIRPYCPSHYNHLHVREVLVDIIEWK